jgi:hypothetical protein
MVDLNSLVPPNSSLLLTDPANINDQGEIAGQGLRSGCCDIDICGHAFLLILCDDNHPGVEGCDYSLVDTSTAAQARADSLPPPWRTSITTGQLDGGNGSMGD